MLDGDGEEYRYESDSEKSFVSDNDFQPTSIIPTGLVANKGPAPRFKDDSMIVELEHENLKSFDCQNGFAAQLGDKGTLIIRDANSDAEPLKVKIPSAEKVFISPNGAHALVSTVDGDIHYFSTKNGPRCTAVQKVNTESGGRYAFVADSVCWCEHRENHSGMVLLGSRKKGLIYACRVDLSQTQAGGIKGSRTAAFSYCRYVLQLPDSDDNPISGIVSDYNTTTRQTTVLVSTRTRMYPFAAAGYDPEKVLQSYSHGDKECHIQNMSSYSDTSVNGTLSVFRPKLNSSAVSYAWSHGGGVQHGLMNPPTTVFHSATGGGLDDDAMDDDDEEEGGCPITPKGTVFASSLLSGTPTDKVPVGPPIDIVHTAFHLILLYDSRIVVLAQPMGLTWRSNTSGHLQYDDFASRMVHEPVHRRGARHFKGICRDEQSRQIYYYTSHDIYILRIGVEHLGQWSRFLDAALEPTEAHRRRYFEAAFKLSFASAPQRDAVSYAYGQYLIDVVGDDAEGTRLLAHCGRFEDVYRYLSGVDKKRVDASSVSVPRRGVTLAFLEKRYKFLLQFRPKGKGGEGEINKVNPDAIYGMMSEMDSTANLVETFAGRTRPLESLLLCLLTGIVHLRLEDDARKESITRNHHDPHEDLDHSDGSSKELKEYLVNAVDNHTDSFKHPKFYRMISSLLASQGRIDITLALAQKLGHVHYTISYYLSQEKFTKACDVLVSESSNAEGERSGIWYEFAPTIMQHCPFALVTGMLRFRLPAKDTYLAESTTGCSDYYDDDGLPPDRLVRALDPERLLPAFVQYDPASNENMSHEHQVISLLESCIEVDGNRSKVVHNYYVSLLAKYDVARLRAFLDSTAPIFYDPEYALRQCLVHFRKQHCVPLYLRLGLYEDAIMIALYSTERRADGEWEGLKRVQEQILNKRPKGMDSATFKKLWLMVANEVIKVLSTRDALQVVEKSNDVLRLEDILAFVSEDTVIQNFKQAICNSLNRYTTEIAKLAEDERLATETSNAIKREKQGLQHRFGAVSAKQTCELCKKGIFQHGGEPFLVYPGCQHVFHEGCVLRKLEGMDGVIAFKTEEGLTPGYLEGVRSVVDLASVECVLCGECAIIEVGKNIEEDSSWDI